MANPPRRPRFKRRDPPPFRPTDDDRVIATHVLEHRLLRSTHLVQLMNRPPDKLLRRLATLYHNGYLDRPRGQRGRGANAPLIYALGYKGGQLFGEPDGIDWTGKNRTAGVPYIEHTLMTADFMVALECALRSHPTIRLLRAPDIAEIARQSAGFAPRSWAMTAYVEEEGADISVLPDKVFGLEFTDIGRRNYFLLEADRSTMPVSRSSLEQSSFKKKLLTYHLGHEAQRHRTLWGIPGFRVLTITSSAKRMASMIAAVKEITSGKGSNVFLFAEARIMIATNPVTTPWISGKGEAIMITPTPNRGL